MGKLQILDNDYGDAGLVQWIRAQLGYRGGSNFEVPESKHETSENGLTRMHLDTHSYLSHISSK